MLCINSEQVLEGFPIQVKGHRHNVECVVIFLKIIQLDLICQLFIAGALYQMEIW